MTGFIGLGRRGKCSSTGRGSFKGSRSKLLGRLNKKKISNQVHHEGYGGGEDHGLAGEEAEVGRRGVDGSQENSRGKQAHHAGANQSFFVVFNILDMHQLRIFSFCASH